MALSGACCRGALWRLGPGPGPGLSRARGSLGPLEPLGPRPARGAPRSLVCCLSTKASSRSILAALASKAKRINGRYERFLERTFPRFYVLYATFTKGIQALFLEVKEIRKIKSKMSRQRLSVQQLPYREMERLRQVKYELLLEKECQLRDLENKLGEYIASLAFQKTVKKSKMLELYTAIISVQALLFEQLSTSKTLSKLECMQILEAHNPEIEELDRKLEYEMLRKESAQQQQPLMSRQRWTPDGLGLSSEAVETNADRQVTVLLRQAMNKCRQFINLHQQSLRDEQWNCAVLEDLLENIEMDAFLSLYSQELRLAGYLAKLMRVPMGILHRILNLLLPSSSQSEVLSVLDSIGKYSDGVAESESANESGSCKKRKNQELWQALENKVRQDLINRSLEKIPSLNKRTDSLIKKKQLALLEKAMFIHLGCSPTRPPMEQSDPPVPFNTAAAETIELLDTGEKVFLFRELSDPIPSLHNSPRKKKKNFLNSKKAACANTDL